MEHNPESFSSAFFSEDLQKVPMFVAHVWELENVVIIFSLWFCSFSCLLV